MPRKSKKPLSLVPYQRLSSRIVRELESVIRGIYSGEIISVAFVIIRRDGTMRANIDTDDPIKCLGSIDMLKERVRVDRFELK